MASSPSNMSPWPGVKEPLHFPAPAAFELAPEAVTLEPHHITDSGLVLNRLREQIAAGKQEPDVLLGAIAVAALAMTDATGAALGVRRDGTVTCVGRSGETAPALGAKLSESSGISGECLRSGRSQRCDDTENDPRVDAEVCRHLGLRSVAAVPIRSRLETVGILEVFSTLAHAFTEEHLSQLSSLAELADVISSPKTAIADSQPDVRIGPTFEPLSRPDLPILASPWEQPGKSRKMLWWYLAGAGTALVLALFLFASWRMLRELRSRNSTQAVTQPQTTAPANNETLTLASSNLPAKPTPEQISLTQPATKNSPRGAVIPAASTETEPDDGLIRSIPVDPPAAAKTQNASTKPADVEITVPPQVSMISSNEDPLHGVFATTISLPQLEKQHSQGAVPIVLERRVMPLYPRQAMTLRREGAVVIHAIVSEVGHVSQMKVLSGDPILGRAAMDAIRQWRYRPALLNGKPTASETDITLNFKLP